MQPTSDTPTEARTGLNDLLLGSSTPLPDARIYIFGASGDLVSKREMRDALTYMAEHDILTANKTPVILIGSKAYDGAKYLAGFKTGDSASHPISEKGYEGVVKLSHLDAPGSKLMGVDVSTESGYEALKSDIGKSNGVFYGALPPKVYPDLLRNLKATGLAEPEEDKGFRYVLLEKPFGVDLPSAQQLKAQVDKDFQPGQVVLIDHFLAYPGTLNMLEFRTTPEADEALNSKYVERFEVRLLEKIKSNDRPYFRETGVIRDMIQSHAIMLLATMALDMPETFAGEHLQDARKLVIDQIVIDHDSARIGQYEGFNDPKQGAPADAKPSDAETFVKFDFKVNTERWKGVPFHLVNGKGVSEARFGLDIHFKTLPEGLAKKFGVKPGQSGVIAITVNRDPKIELRLKDGSKQLLKFDSRISMEPPHALLIPDALKGERGLFVSPAEALKAWELTDELLESLKGKPVLSYIAGADVDTIT
jgi:glucose-6-phosphate 1-dehydrogenase